MAELAEASGLTETAVVEAQAAAIIPLSLEGSTTPDGATLEGVREDTSAQDPEGELLAAERARIVRDAVADLADRERFVISRRFGFDEGEASVASLANDLRLSERRTRMLEHDALHVLAARSPLS